MGHQVVMSIAFDPVTAAKIAEQSQQVAVPAKLLTKGQARGQVELFAATEKGVSRIFLGYQKNCCNRERKLD